MSPHQEQEIIQRLEKIIDLLEKLVNKDEEKAAKQFADINQETNQPVASTPVNPQPNPTISEP